MFRRTLLVFVALLFLALAVTLGYAALNLSGPEHLIANARGEFAREEYASAILTLERAEQSLGPNGPLDLRRAVYDVRHQAYYGLGNVHSALRSLHRLRELSPDIAELAQREVRWTIESGDPETALQLAEAQLRNDPEDPLTLELAGEALQARYQQLTRAFLIDYGTLLDDSASKRAFLALRTWLYRDENDPVAAYGLDEFEAILKQRRPEAYANGSYAVELREIRDLVTRAQQYFRLALEAEDAQPVGAYLGLSYALRQGRHDNDRQWLGEIYLHRFQHLYALRAAIDLAEMHLHAGRHRATVEVVQRFMPRGTWREMLAEHRIDSELRFLMLAEARALSALNDTEQLAALQAEAQEIQEAEALQLEPELLWITALSSLAQDDFPTGLAALTDYNAALIRLPQSEETIERRIAVIEQLIGIAQQRNWSAKYLANTFRNLARIDSDNPQHLIESSRQRMQDKDPQGALMDLELARSLSEHDDGLLQTRAAVIDEQRKKTGRDSDSILARCLELDIDPPFSMDKELLLPLAEKALAGGHLELAMTAATRASREFNWARWPRYLMAKAALEADDPSAARQACEGLLLHHPGDLEGLRLQRQAYQQLGLPIRPLTYDLLVAGEEDASVARSLLQSAFDRTDLALCGHLIRTLQQRWPDDVPSLLLIAEVEQARQRYDEARGSLDRALALTRDNSPELFMQATNQRLLLALASDENPTEVEDLFDASMRLSAEDTDGLVRLAVALEELQQPELAYRTLTRILDHQRHSDARSGKLYRMAGELAIQLDRPKSAERYLTAAIPNDEMAALRPLSLLLLSQGRASEALSSYFEPEVHDLVSAVLTARAGRVQPALLWSQRRLRESEANLQAYCLRALISPKDPVPEEVRALERAAHDQLLETLTFLEADGFEAHALACAQDLLAKVPDNPLALTLLARAYSGVGDREQALATLAKVIDRAPDSRAVYDVARGMLEKQQQSGSDIDRQLERFLDPDKSRKPIEIRRTVEAGGRRDLIRLLDGASEQDQLLEGLAELWANAPGDSDNVLDAIDFLSQQGNTELALQVCDAIAARIDAADRDRFLNSYFDLASRRIAQTGDDALRQRMIATADRYIAEIGPAGILVHFLIDQDVAVCGPLDQTDDGGADNSVDEADEGKDRSSRIDSLLQSHIDHVLAGLDPDADSIRRTVLRLHELHGRSRAIEVADSFLHYDPSLVQLWVLRAIWMMREGHIDEGVQSLDWIYKFAPGAPIVLGCIELTARAGRSEIWHERHLREHLDPELIDSPNALHAFGLLALRQANYQRAFELLEEGAEHDDGSHLYFAGLAALALGDRETARQRLDTLARDYPNSTLSFNAGHFARQLAD